MATRWLRMFQSQVLGAVAPSVDRSGLSPPKTPAPSRRMWSENWLWFQRLEFVRPERTRDRPDGPDGTQGESS